MDHALDWRVKWMDALQQHCQAGLHKRCDEISALRTFASPLLSETILTRLNV
jgi:hypothetical protein